MAMCLLPFKELHSEFRVFESTENENENKNENKN